MIAVAFEWSQQQYNGWEASGIQGRGSLLWGFSFFFPQLNILLSWSNVFPWSHALYCLLFWDKTWNTDVFLFWAEGVVECDVMTKVEMSCTANGGLLRPRIWMLRASGDSDRSGGGTRLCRVDPSMSSVPPPAHRPQRAAIPRALQQRSRVRISHSQCDTVVRARLVGFRLHESTQGTADDAEIYCSTDVLPRS